MKGRVVVDTKKVQLSLYVDRSIIKPLKFLALSRDTSVGSLIEGLVRKELSKEEVIIAYEREET